MELVLFRYLKSNGSKVDWFPWQPMTKVKGHRLSRSVNNIHMNDLEQGQGHLIRGQMLKINQILGYDLLYVNTC